MKKLLLLGFLLIGLQSFGQSPKDRQTILGILQRQTEAWNAGNLDNFMKGYWESDSLMYIGKSGVKYGYQTTLANYKKNYPNLATMGKLKFDIIKVDFPAKDVCFLVGQWHLTRPEKGDIGGHYTLLWKKINGKWLIIADHSS